MLEQFYFFMSFWLQKRTKYSQGGEGQNQENRKKKSEIFKNTSRDLETHSELTKTRGWLTQGRLTNTR